MGGRSVAEEVISLESRRVQRKHIRRKRWKVTPRFFLFLLLLLSLWIALGFAARYFRIVSLQNQLVRIRREIAAMEARNEELEKQIEYLQSDEYIEKVAREKLGLVKPGETVYIMAEPANRDDRFYVPRRPGETNKLEGGF